MQPHFADVAERLMSRFEGRVSPTLVIRVAFAARADVEKRGLGWQPEKVEALADRALTAIAMGTD